MHSELKPHKYGRDTRGSHMAEEMEYGIKIIFKSGERDKKWFANKRQRDMSLPYHKALEVVKSAKAVERKKK